MTEISLSVLFRGFNTSKFILYTCLLVFVILFSLKLDGILKIHYAFVFLPLWICNIIVFFGAVGGMISFLVKPPPSNDVQLRIDFIAMLLTTFEHMLLMFFETLVYYKLQFAGEDLRVSWVLVFSPLFSLSVLSIALSVWAIRHDKPFEFELFFAVNVVQFVFIAFKLDDQVEWSWAVVFIPMWVVLSLSVVGVLYALILAVLLARSRHLMPAHRRHHLYSAVFHTLLVVPALVCFVLLTGKLDALAWSDNEPASELPYTIVATPLAVSLLCMSLMACGSRGGNVWWYGMRRPFCSWILEACPCLRQYANVSYKMGMRRTSSEGADPPPLINSDELERAQKTVEPVNSIESPD